MFCTLLELVATLVDFGWSSQIRKEKQKGLNISGYQQIDNYAREGQEVLLILAHVIVVSPCQENKQALSQN